MISSDQKNEAGFVPSENGRFCPIGFVPSKFKEVKQAIDKLDIEKTELAGVYNIPSKHPPKLENKKRSNVSKYVTYNRRFIHEGVEYQILADKGKKHGIYSQMMHRAIEQLNICQSKWNRVFALAFNLHHKDIERHDSTWISRFRKNLLRRLERSYGMNEVGYIWAREKETAKGQHYHYWLFLDGRLVNHHKRVLEIVEATWQKINETNHVARIRNTPFYDIRDNGEVKQSAVERISYCCKARGKGYRQSQNKDYSASRLSPDQKISVSNQ